MPLRSSCDLNQIIVGPQLPTDLPEVLPGPPQLLLHSAPHVPMVCLGQVALPIRLDWRLFTRLALMWFVGDRMERRLPGPSQTQELLQTECRSLPSGVPCLIFEITFTSEALLPFSLQDKIEANKFC